MRIIIFFIHLQLWSFSERDDNRTSINSCESMLSRMPLQYFHGANRAPGRLRRLLRWSTFRGGFSTLIRVCPTGIARPILYMKNDINK